MKLYCAILCCCISFSGFAQEENHLWYKEPASRWTEALPVGNGRLGAMVFGGVDDELLQLNESSLWSGGPVQHNINPDAKAYLAKCRASLFKNDFDSAEYYARKIQGLYTESYLPMADLKMHQTFPGKSSPSAYTRDLNLQDAVSVTRFTKDGIQYKREVFVSAPAQLIVMRITADKPKQIILDISLSSVLHFNRKPAGADALTISGKAPSKDYPSYTNNHPDAILYTDSGGCRGMRFAVMLRAVSKDGSMRTDSSGLHIKDASELVLFISAATSFNGFDKCPDKDGKDEDQLAKGYFSGAKNKNFDDLYKAHLNDFHHFYNRVSLYLADSNEIKNRTLPTDIRLENYDKSSSDHGLESLYFNYGRYLLISSSRTPNAPANLQGIWNKEIRPPWSSNYTTNINLQMNYWPVESANLSELNQPLTNLIEHLYITGKRTAMEFYGAHGWVVHHNSDIWAISNPVGDLGTGDPRWANWSMGANWLSRHLWDHYLFTQNKTFLRDTAYPLMKEAVRFTFDWLIPDSSGHLVTAPSFSPENGYFYADKKSTGITVASTMDMSIIRDLFSNTIEAAGILGLDKSFCDTISEKESRL